MLHKASFSGLEVKINFCFNTYARKVLNCMCMYLPVLQKGVSPTQADPVQEENEDILNNIRSRIADVCFVRAR
jgi:hypothetical protein